MVRHIRGTRLHLINQKLQVRDVALAGPLEQLPKSSFVRAWSSIAYLFPGLHPDGFEGAESGWPHVVRRFAAEAWRRADTLALMKLFRRHGITGWRRHQKAFGQPDFLFRRNRLANVIS